MTEAVATDRALAAPVRSPRARRRIVPFPVRSRAFVAAAFLVLLPAVAVLAPLIAPHDPAEQDLLNAFAPLSADHWLGTDHFGRDVFSRLVYATRITVVGPPIAIAVAAVIGIPMGLWAGHRRGAVDLVAGRAADTLLSLPSFVTALSIVAVLGPSLVNAMIAIGIAFSPGLFRLTRGATMETTRETYIESAHAIGSSTPRTLGVHVLPNIAGPLLVQITLLMGVALLIEASLSFLGLGVKPPESSWGSMLRAAYDNQFQAPYSVIPPGVALVLTVLAINTVGDAASDRISAGKRER